MKIQRGTALLPPLPTPMEAAFDKMVTIKFGGPKEEWGGNKISFSLGGLRVCQPHHSKIIREKGII